MTKLTHGDGLLPSDLAAENISKIPMVPKVDMEARSQRFRLDTTAPAAAINRPQRRQQFFNRSQ